MVSTILRPKEPIIILSLLFLITIGGFLRLYDLNSQPYWMDEGYTVNAVLSIIEKGNTVLDSGEYYFCPLYCYPTAALVKMFGNLPENYRLLSALVGTVFIGITYWIASRFFAPSVGLLSAFFTAFAYFQIAWSRQARWYTLFELFFWIAVFLFFQTLYGEKKYRRWYAVGAISATILAMSTHGLGYLLPFIFGIWAILDLVFIQKQWHWKLLIILFAFMTGTAAVTELLIRNWRFSIFSNITFENLAPYYTFFYARTYWPILLFAVTGLALLGIQLFRRRESIQFTIPVIYILFVTLAYVVPLMFLTEILHYRYFFHLTPAIFILGALGAILLGRQLPKMYTLMPPTLALLFFFTAGTGMLIPQSFYNLESDDPEKLPGRSYYAYTPQPNWNDAYGFIAQNSSEDDIVISSHPHFNKIFLGKPGYWIKYDYFGIRNIQSNSDNDREYYVGAKVIDDVTELKTLTRSTTGYIVFDYMFTDGRVSDAILNYIRGDLQQVFHERTNEYSQIWVYKF